MEAVSSEQLLAMVGGAYVFVIGYCLYKKIEIPKVIYLFVGLIVFEFHLWFLLSGKCKQGKCSY